ncbi:VOC family protein [Paraburkholderia sp. ZP32-5]|uniref:VOC family protein n=1 Tax=Paraburkholderia sp. ZP32-5 TaxID=2883245 RepID=UPI001F1B8AD7|nr:VOC family protein [Paraburkholderia sp. ZP32-5]
MNAIREVYAYLRVRNAAQAIEFYAQAFGGVEQFRLTEPSGRIGHAEVKIGPAIVMLSDEYPEHGMLGPGADSTTSVLLHIHCDDVDQLVEQAVNAGATLIRPPTDHFYGERSATLRDPFGHEWMLGSQIEALTPEEMQRRYTALFDE